MRSARRRSAGCLGLGLLTALPSYAKEPTALPAPTLERPADRRAEPPPADLTEQAKQLYLLGAEAFAAQRNADAISYFRQAERLVPSAKLSYNIALAYDEMGDTGRALHEYRAFLVREPNSVHRDEAKDRSAKLELALAALGVQQLRVVSDPPGATLRVDDGVMGVTPWAGELSPGLHRIRLDHAGYHAHQAEVALSAEHSADVQIALLVQPAIDAPASSSFARVQPLSWCFLGVGLGALGGGLGFEFSRAASSARAGRAGTPEAVARAQGASDAKKMASLLLLGAGGAFVVGGTVLLALDLNRDADSVKGGTSTNSATTMSLPCTRDFCGLMTQGSF